MRCFVFVFTLLMIASANATVDPTIRMKDLKTESGIASWYGYNTGAPACGLAMGANTAAHKTLPCGTMVKVTNRKNGKIIVVKIVDRGPFVAGRVIDLSPEAARSLGMGGLAPVTLEVVGK